MPRLQQWTPSEGFYDKYVAYYEAQLSDLPANTIIAFSHARRIEKEETRSSRLIDMLRKYAVYDVPLWLPEDVPHDNQGLFRGSHYKKELAYMRSAASTIIGTLTDAVLAGKVVSVGYAALQWLQPLYPQEIEAGLLANVPHYSRLASNSGERNYFHSIIDDKLKIIGKDFMGLEEFSTQLSTQLSENMLEVWSQRSSENRRDIGRKISRTKASLPANWKATTKARMLLTWSQKTESELDDIRRKISQTKRTQYAALTPQERASAREKRAKLLASRSAEERGASLQKFKNSLHARTDAQRAATRKKWLNGFMVRKLRWKSELTASLVRDPIRRQNWIDNLRASIARRTPAEWARIYAIKLEKYYSRPEWSHQHSLQVMAMHARKPSEERALENAKHIATCAAWTDEFRSQRRINICEAVAARTPEARSAKVDKFKATQAAKSEKEVAASSIRRKAAAANMTEETRSSKAKKIAEIRAKDTQDQKDARKEINLKTISEKKNKEAAEQMQRLQTGQMTAEERFKIVKNGNSRIKYQSENSSSSSSNTLDEVFRAVQTIYAARPDLVLSDRKAYLSKS